MKESVITENAIKNAVFQILNEEASKVKREEFNRVQYKIEELENSLSETLKELRKLDDCVPSGLKTVCDNRIKLINEKLSEVQSITMALKSKVRKHKKAAFSQPIEEKKK